MLWTWTHLALRLIFIGQFLQLRILIFCRETGRIGGGGRTGGVGVGHGESEGGGQTSGAADVARELGGRCSGRWRYL